MSDDAYFLYFTSDFSATPADVSLLMQLGVDGVFVGSGIFKSSNPPERAVAMAQAVTHYKDPKILAELSSDLGSAMFGMPVNRSGKSSSYSKTGSDEKNIWDATLGDPAKFPVNQVH